MDKTKQKKIIWFSVLGVAAVLLAAAGIYIYMALAQPESLFGDSSDKSLASKPMIQDVDGVSPSPLPPPPQTKDHIINVLLLGLDQDYKTYAAHGGDFHTDSIIVLAINFDKKTVDMISLPRDTFTHVPGVKGIYKLNAAINCGGGKTEAGFNKVCEAASWMLGGISIDYYYAFELQTVIDIGNMIGGVDFDVDMAYRGTSGTHYKKGMQHLNGTGIYDYMRARKNATGEQGDKGRMNRGKAMLKAIFQKLKQQNMLTQLPSLLNTVSQGLYTNTNLQQSIALANFAYNDINADNIKSHTMDGDLHNVLSWNFYFLDQQARKALMYEVYGIDIPEQQDVSYAYAKWLGAHGFKAIRYLSTAYDIIMYKQDTALTEAYRNTQAAFKKAASALDDADNNLLQTACENLRAICETFAKINNYPEKLSWSVKSAWYQDSCINEVNVDFN